MVSDGTNVTYYFDDQAIGQYASASTPICLLSVMPQAFHYDYQHTDGRWFYPDYTCETYFCNINYTSQSSIHIDGSKYFRPLSNTSC